MRRHLILIYGIIGYLIGLGTLSYMILWLYPFSWMPTTIDSTEASSLSSALIIDIGLILAFGLQHSLMVRPTFKYYLERYTPKGSSRTNYTLISSFFLALIIYKWQTVEGVVWSFDIGSFGWWLMTLIYLVAWVIAVVATFQIDHFGLLGLHQAWREWRGIPEPKSTFQERGFYRFVRHPIQAGTIIGLWATPIMSIGHLIFSLSFSVYILIGLYFEERDLLQTLGQPYANYRKRVAMLIPFTKRRASEQRDSLGR